MISIVRSSFKIWLLESWGWLSESSSRKADYELFRSRPQSTREVYSLRLAITIARRRSRTTDG